LSVAALGFASQSAQAATVLITGGDKYDDLGGAAVYPDFPGYGTLASNNNVVNSGVAIVTDGTGGAAWHLAATVNSTILGIYQVDWWYLGSESGQQTYFAAPVAAPTAGFLEPSVGLAGDANNNFGYGGNGPAATTVPNPVPSGTSTQVGAIIDFEAGSVTVGSVANGANPIPAAGVLSLIMAYADVTTDGSGLPTAAVLKTARQDWFVVGYNDTGLDDNHDDIMFLAHVRCPEGVSCATTSVVPLPPAVLMFGSALAGLGLLGMRRRRIRSVA
jgi:MYXO-CTERM domain-containing protein